eukprot:TRINITY_DN46662_c0_g1_i1.p1 TRINITY_DN46662_c0_g1~~TRINITY_DN46662_c0_g1_i1.p1  ORF type:complete len:471 (-),score=98.48 TRINITY_DN46662_c0_g1_i1:73-1413(-)
MAAAKLGYIGRHLETGEQKELWLSRLGGAPAWPVELTGQKETPSGYPAASSTGDQKTCRAAGNSDCGICGAPMALVGQFHAGYDGASRRFLYLFACTGQCGASDSKAWRAVRITANSADAEGSTSAAPAVPDADEVTTSGAGAADDWGATASAGGDDWGATTSAGGDDWGADASAHTSADGWCTKADDELDALLQARGAALASSSTQLKASSGRAVGSRSAAAALSSSDDIDSTWVGSLGDVPEVTWPCHAVEIYDEPDAPPKSGDHERELLERYLQSDLAEEEGGNNGGGMCSLPPEIVEELRAEDDAKMWTQDDDDIDEMDVESEDGKDEEAATWLSKFQRRLERSPSQVARYAWGGSPLWLAPPPEALAPGKRGPPCCSRCGAGRVFELQLLPTLLTQMRDWCPDFALGARMDWGTVVVYTCERDCAADSTCCEEFVVVQPAV